MNKNSRSFSPPNKNPNMAASNNKIQNNQLKKKKADNINFNANVKKQYA